MWQTKIVTFITQGTATVDLSVDANYLSSHQADWRLALRASTGNNIFVARLPTDIRSKFSIIWLLFCQCLYAKLSTASGPGGPESSPHDRPSRTTPRLQRVVGIRQNTLRISSPARPDADSTIMLPYPGNSGTAHMSQWWCAVWLLSQAWLHKYIFGGASSPNSPQSLSRSDCVFFTLNLSTGTIPTQHCKITLHLRLPSRV